MVSSHSGPGSSGSSRSQIKPVGRGHKKHHQIGHKIDQGVSQIPGRRQHQHMGRGRGRGHGNGLKVRGTVKHGGHKKHKADLHKLRRLEGEAADGDGKLGPVGCISQKAYGGQQGQSQAAVDPGDLCQLPHPVNDQGDDPRDHSRCRHDHKLAHGPGGV